MRCEFGVYANSAIERCLFASRSAINFNAVAQAGSGATINQVTQAYQDPNVTFDPGGRLMQLVFRFNF